MAPAVDVARLDQELIACLSHSLRALCLPTVVEENNVKLRLNIVDTPGYGDLINNDGW
jgi:septin family protein